MANLIEPHEVKIWEPFAGTGQIAKFLPEGTYCMEVDRQRAIAGKKKAPHCYWTCSNFFYDEPLPVYDAIVTNPPFTLGIEAIARSLEFLKPTGRLLYLLPLDYLSSKKRGHYFMDLNAHIHHIHRIVGRVAYLKNGAPVKGRQIYDAIFDIRLGKNAGCETMVRID